MKIATIVITAIAAAIQLLLLFKGIDIYGLGSIADKDTAQNLLLLAIAMRAITVLGDE